MNIFAEFLLFQTDKGKKTYRYIPKIHIESTNHLTSENSQIVAHIFVTAVKIAQKNDDFFSFRENHKKKNGFSATKIFAKKPFYFNF